MNIKKICKKGIILFLLVFALLSTGCNDISTKTTNLNSFEWEEISGGIVITKYKGDEKTVVVPSIIDNKKVISVGTSFSGNVNLETLVLSDNITEITEDTCDLSNCDSLTSLTIPAELETTLSGNYTIEGLTHLDSVREINLPNVTGTIDIGDLPLSVEKINIPHISCIISPMDWYGFWSIEESPIGEVILPEEIPLYYREATYEYEGEKQGQSYAEKIYYEKPSDYDDHPSLYKAITEENKNDVFLSFFGTDTIVINNEKIS